MNNRTKATIEPRNIEIKLRKYRDKITIYINKDRFTVEVNKRQSNKLLSKLIKKRYLQPSDVKKQNEIEIKPQLIELKPWNDIMTIKLGELTGDSVHVLLDKTQFNDLKKNLEEKGYIPQEASK